MLNQISISGCAYWKSENLDPNDKKRGNELASQGLSTKNILLQYLELKSGE